MITISQLPLQQLCQAYQLGVPNDIRQVAGGLLHQVFHLQTSKGEFAIKCLAKLDALAST